MPGVGKSTFGKKLAAQLGLSFLDLDDAIEQRAGRSIPQIFEADGESAFREYERDAVEEACALENTVVSCGGGAPCYHENGTNMLTSGYVIYLEASAAFIVSRLMQSPGKRPLIDGSENPEATIHALYESRKTTYEKAHLCFPVPSGNMQELMEELKRAGYSR